MKAYRLFVMLFGTMSCLPLFVGCEGPYRAPVTNLVPVGEAKAYVEFYNGPKYQIPYSYQDYGKLFSTLLKPSEWGYSPQAYLLKIENGKEIPIGTLDHDVLWDDQRQLFLPFGDS